MRLQFLGKGGSNVGGCPSLYATDRQTYVVQGWETGDPATVEIPHLLLGFAEPDTFLGAELSDTGRGTFRISGTPVTDGDALTRMALPHGETGIEVPRLEWTFYGATHAG